MEFPDRRFQPDVTILHQATEQPSHVPLQSGGNPPEEVIHVRVRGSYLLHANQATEDAPTMAQSSARWRQYLVRESLLGLTLDQKIQTDHRPVGHPARSSAKDRACQGANPDICSRFPSLIEG